MTEKRIAPRSRTFLRAEIDVDGISSLPCIVRDLTDDGARLIVSDGVLLPETFRLRLSKPDRWVAARLCWRRDDQAGVALRAVAAADVAETDANHLRQLEAEVLKLRKILDELRRDPSKLHELLDPAA